MSHVTEMGAELLASLGDNGDKVAASLTDHDSAGVMTSHAVLCVAVFLAQQLPDRTIRVATSLSTVTGECGCGEVHAGLKETTALFIDAERVHITEPVAQFAINLVTGRLLDFLRPQPHATEG